MNRNIRKRKIILLMMIIWLISYFSLIMFYSEHFTHQCSQSHCSICTQLEILKIYKKRFINVVQWQVNRTITVLGAVIGLLFGIVHKETTLVDKKVRINR